MPFNLLLTAGYKWSEKPLNPLKAANPTADYLTLEVNDIEPSTLNFQLYDLQGKLLLSQIITDKKTSIVISNLLPASYFVKVFQANKEKKTFKIIKTD
ncbi:MAG: T9SS type A sorting domain-containing protein [Bacteroidales bacterium]|jgi:hypothetical protein|nr:T9SS type A sorting domain-containing protein [Bacteroidales bacterium]MDD4213801.1 T9SS type A sorting domain-containing protein [Bacteroidales bacterium]